MRRRRSLSALANFKQVLTLIRVNLPTSRTITTGSDATARARDLLTCNSEIGLTATCYLPAMRFVPPCAVIDV